MIMDETLHSVAERVKNFAIIWKVDIDEVPDFTKVCVVIVALCSVLERAFSPAKQVLRG